MHTPAWKTNKNHTIHTFVDVRTGRIQCGQLSSLVENSYIFESFLLEVVCSGETKGTCTDDENLGCCRVEW